MTRYGASNVQIGCSLRSELNWTWVGGMSSPLSNKSCNRAGLFKRPVHSSASSRWPQALVQNRKQLRLRSFVLAAWPSCRGPRQPAANELGGGPVRHVLSPSSNAWPARPRHTRPRHIPRPNSLRALHRVPSNVVLCAYLPGPHSVEASGSAFPIKTGSEFPIGITERKRQRTPPIDCQVVTIWAGGTAKNRALTVWLPVSATKRFANALASQRTRITGQSTPSLHAFAESRSKALDPPVSRRSRR